MTSSSRDQPLLASSTEKATLWTLKVELDSEVRRARDVNIWADHDDPLRILRMAVGTLFDLNSDQVAALHFRYGDDEAELCTLTNTTFADAVSLAGTSQTLRLKAEIKLPSDAAAVAIVPSASADTQHNEGSIDCAQPDASRRTLTERLSAVHNSVTEQIADVHCNVTGRLDSVRPGLGQSLACFTKQIKKDFETGREDMRDAFAKGSEENNTMRQVAAVASGVVMATRFVPVRMTRLATKSVAAFMGSPSNSNTPEAPTASPGATTAETVGNARNELDNFKQLVTRDFCMARDEIKGAVTDVVGRDDLTASVSAQNFRRDCPAVAGTVAGVSVAATLLPLRVATLAVASLAGRSVAATDASADTACVIQETTVMEEDSITEQSVMETASGESVIAEADNLEPQQKVPE